MSEDPRPGGALGPAALAARQRKGIRNPNRGKLFPVEVLTAGEAQRLIAACSMRSAVGIRNRAHIAVLYRGGLRCKESLDLEPKDIDLEQGAISVLSGKGGKRRTVGIDPGSIALVEHWLAKRAELGIGPRAPLFCTLEGTRMHSSYLRDLLPRLAVKAAIYKRVHPHGLRHTHAYELMNEGVPLGIIQKQLGHSQLQTTARYLDHFAPEAVLKAMRARQWSAEDNGANGNGAH